MRPDIVLNRAAQIALACVIGLLVITFLNLPKGYWVVWTIMIIYCVFMPGAVYCRVGERVIGTFVGVIVAFFVVKLIQVDYELVYLLAILFFFLNFSMGVSYAYGVIFVTVIVVLSEDYLMVSAGASQVVFDRLVGTAVGALIVLAVEIFFYKISKTSEKMIHYKLEEFCEHYARYIDVLIATLENDNKQERLNYQGMINVLKSRAEVEKYLNDEFVKSKKNLLKYNHLVCAIKNFRNKITKITFMIQNLKSDMFPDEDSVNKLVSELKLIQTVLIFPIVENKSQVTLPVGTETKILNLQVNDMLNSLYKDGKYISDIYRNQKTS